MSQPTIINPSRATAGQVPIADGTGDHDWSSPFASRRTILRGAGCLAGSLGATTRLVGLNVIGAASSNITSGIPVLYIASADFTATGLTPMLRTRLVAAANATAPGGTLTLGLYPVTTAGISGGITWTLGTVVTDSTAAIASLSGSARDHAESSDYALPSDGYYALGIANGSSTNASSFTDIVGTVDLRYV